MARTQSRRSEEASGLKSASLVAALERAVEGHADDLLRQLELQSGLPGPRMNLSLAVAFANDVARVGSQADDLVWRMASLPANEARGASGKEFVVACGVLAVGVRARIAEESAVQTRALALFEQRADDLRFRVRDVVPLALANVGARLKSELVDRLTPWMDRYFHAAAAAKALGQRSWLETFDKDDYEGPLDLLQAAFVLAHDAPRSAIRYPGHKALVEALGWVPMMTARRFGRPVLDRLSTWAEGARVPELREAILANLDDAQLKKPFADDYARVREAVEASKPPPRDPARIVHGTRGRGKKRG